MQALEQQQFSEIFYRRHRKHTFRFVAKIAVLLAILGSVAGLCLSSFFQGRAGSFGTGAALAAFLFFAWAAYRGIREQLHVRLVPYFERRLGSVTTFLVGRDLLYHSRRLDEIASRLGQRPLSEFASGDDMIWGEALNWFSPEEALETIERLLKPDVTNDLPAGVISDLKQMREALNTARSQNVRFCFLIREGSSASGAEMDRRKGSFF